MKRIIHRIKFIFDLAFFSFLVGSSIALFSGIVAELIYPKVVNEYWAIWWIGWIIGVAIWDLITIKEKK